ncbi:MAG TPA: hypothetical protein ENK02_07005 [Planctomycetes bacterium]|nr:hypothetical protein [Planctomycetota bacterium]
MSRFESRLPWLLALALVLSSPWVLREPRRTLPYEDWAAFGVTLALRPLGLGMEVLARTQDAGMSPEAGMTYTLERAPSFRRYVEVLEKALLPRKKERGERLLLPVRGALGRGAGGAPRALRLVGPPGLSKPQALSGLPAVFGESYVGRIESSSRGELRLRFPWSTAKGRSPERLIAQARSQRPGDFPVLEMIVEPAGPKDPFPLRVALANPAQAQTWTPDRYPFWVRLASSRELHPDLPAGLLLGSLEDVGYPQTGFVLRRYVRPLFDPRALPVVAVLLPQGSRLAEGVTLPWDQELRTTPVEILWRSPRRLGALRFLLRGGSPRGGDAVFSGGKLLWVYDWAREGVGMAVPAYARGGRLPALAIPLRGKPRAVLLRGAGRDALGHGLFTAPSLPPGGWKLYEGGRFFTGVAGRGFPAGLLIGKVLAVRNGLFVLEKEPGASRGLFVVAGGREP